MLRERLGASLPDYMVPSAFHWRDEPAADRQRQDRQEGADRARRASSTLVADEDRGAAHADRAAAGGCLGRRCSASRSDQIGRQDHFFDRGGTSLSAVKLAIALKRAVSLKDITRHPVLADLAALVDGRAERRAGLLQLAVGVRTTPPEAALVCFPYAGGNAVNFQPMAERCRAAARRSRRRAARPRPGRRARAVRADGAGGRAGRRRDQPARGLTRVVLWGHSSGTAPPWRRPGALQERGVEVAAGLPRRAAARRRSRPPRRRRRLTGRSNAEIAARLAADGGYTELGELDAQRAEHIGAAYRHDCVAAHRYFADALDAPPAGSCPCRSPWSSPPTTRARPAFPRRYRDWQLLAEHVDLHELPDGGHYFLRTRPAEAAQAVLRRARELLARRPHRQRQPKGIDMSSSSPASAARRGPCSPASRRCCAVEAAGDAADWAAEHRDALRAVVAEHGAVLVRGLGLRDAAEVGAVFRALAGTADDRAGGLRPATDLQPGACTPPRSGRRTSRCACTTS